MPEPEVCAGMKAMEKALRRGFASAMRDAPTCIGSSPAMRTSESDSVRRRDRPRREFAKASCAKEHAIPSAPECFIHAHTLTKKNEGLLVQVMSSSSRCGHDATMVRKTPLLS